MPSSVNLGERLDAWIAEAVRSGRYRSRSEILREGVRLVQEREAQWARLEAPEVSGAAPGSEVRGPPSGQR